MRILITNDDGVYSPGILALAQVAARFGEVRVVAPDVEMSSAAQSITASRPLTFKRTPLPGVEAYRVNGTPGDCVMLGTTLWEGVEPRALGRQYRQQPGQRAVALGHARRREAGGAARPARNRLQRAVPGQRRTPFEALKPWAETVLAKLLEANDLPLVNVNFPAKPPLGIAWTSQSMRYYDGKVVPGKDPMGRTHYWYTVVPVDASEQGTDRWAIEQGYVSLTPLRLDLTDHPKLDTVRKVEAWKKLKFA